MKKIIALIVLVFAFLLVSCEGSSSPSGAKSNLEKDGYTVEVMNTTEAKARIEGINFVVDPTNALLATKGKEDVVIIFYFNSIDEADKFVKENVSVMYKFAERYSANPKTGYLNNAAYAGSQKACQTAGFPV